MGGSAAGGGCQPTPRMTPCFSTDCLMYPSRTGENGTRMEERARPISYRDAELYLRVLALLNQPFDVAVQNRLRCVEDRLAGIEYNCPLTFKLPQLQPNGFAHAAFHAIADDCFARHGDSETTFGPSCCSGIARQKAAKYTRNFEPRSYTFRKSLERRIRRFFGTGSSSGRYITCVTNCALVADCKFVAALAGGGREQRVHPWSSCVPEPVSFGSLTIVRLKGTFRHCA